MDISKPLKEEKFFRVPGLRNKLIRQRIRYSGFLDMCFACNSGDTSLRIALRTDPGLPQHRLRMEATPITVDNRFGIIGPEEEDDDEVNDLFEIPEEEDQIMEEEVEEARGVDAQGDNLQEDPLQENLNTEDMAEEEPEGGAEVPGAQLLGQNDRFTSFEEAEILLARPASDRKQLENTRLSSAGAQHPIFTEGRKKSRGEVSKLQSVGEEDKSKDQEEESTEDSSNQERKPQNSKSGQAAKTKDKKDRGNRPKVAILGLQELKAREFAAERGLQSIFQGGQTIINYNDKGVGGAALVIKEEVEITARGVKGTGNVAWVKVKVAGAEFGVASIYASTKSHKRIPLWHWLAELTEEGPWLVMGDFNCVELPEDTQGTANLLNGGELRHWKNWVRNTEMVDAFITTVQHKGPRFTRQRIKGDQIEFSRLDRLYLSAGADWVESVEELQHDGRCGLSDHFPIVLTIKTEKEEAQPRPWRTYFKCRTEDLQREGIKEEMKAGWSNHPISVRDPRVRWDLGWQRLKKILQRERKSQKERSAGEDVIKVITSSQLH
ncbi:hypothetical protein R1sor_000962 [Riccia sorocarpa]|uniref:Endonuclease/exonuclease/phosphatase domain-containing protein n=1 Tax=Riccia sorocarpa TaxID=122646 RepID=A0ABD3GXS9_9MARC